MVEICLVQQIHLINKRDIFSMYLDSYEVAGLLELLLQCNISNPGGLIVCV